MMYHMLCFDDDLVNEICFQNTPCFLSNVLKTSRPKKAFREMRDASKGGITGKRVKKVT